MLREELGKHPVGGSKKDNSGAEGQIGREICPLGPLMRGIDACLDDDELQVEVDGICEPVGELRIPREGDRRPGESDNDIRQRPVASAERLMRALFPLPESALG